MKRVVILLVIIVCLILISCKSCTIEEEIEVTAMVTEIRYLEACSTLTPMFNPSTKTTLLIPQNHPERYLVTITYENISTTFDDKTLYESVKSGDIIQMTLCKEYDVFRNVVNQTLQLIEY